MYQNGTPVGSGTGHHALTNASIEVGATFLGSYYLIGNIAEILIYNVADNTTRFAVETYIKQKYGIAAAPAITVSVPVTDPAFKFSPGNWKGDTGRGGSVYRSTWNAGAYFEFQWSASANPGALISMGNGTTDTKISYSVNGLTVDNISANADVQIGGIVPNAVNTLRVHYRNSGETGRYGGTNQLVINGMKLDALSIPGTAPPLSKWIILVGDSITEGINAYKGGNSVLADYSFLVGQELLSRGYDYCINASIGSGYLQSGDYDHLVPAYYSVQSGTYHPELSRWSSIDSGVSLLDSNNHISAYGSVNTEPSLVYINYGTNETSLSASLSDLTLSITGTIGALRSAAPSAQIQIAVPFTIQAPSQYPNGNTYAAAIRTGVTNYLNQSSTETMISLMDFGGDFAKLVESSYFMSTDLIHPNEYGHAYVAPFVSREMNAVLPIIPESREYTY
jgi:hypothetical protein